MKKARENSTFLSDTQKLESIKEKIQAGVRQAWEALGVDPEMIEEVETGKIQGLIRDLPGLTYDKLDPLIVVKLREQGVQCKRISEQGKGYFRCKIGHWEIPLVITLLQIFIFLDIGQPVS